MGTTLRQRLIIGAALLVAFASLGVAIAYSGENEPAGPAFSGSAADGGGVRPDDANSPTSTLIVNPVERWFPEAGEGSGCSEVVGVDLTAGYTALLTINGVPIPVEDTNVYSDFEKKVLSSGGSQGQVTWGPEPDCPFGAILRPTANEIIACIYRLGEGADTCRPIQRPDLFDF